MNYTCVTCGKSFPSWQTVATFVGPDGLGAREVKHTCSRACTPKDKLPKEPRRTGARTFGVGPIEAPEAKK